MNDQVLVTYASKYGATAEIAEKISEALRGAGLSVDTKPVQSANGLKGYKAVVLGSAIYIGRWRKEAVKFLQSNEQTLSKLPVWLFSSGPTGEGNPVELVKGVRVPESLQPLVERIQPRDVTVFHGNVDVQKANFLDKWMISKVNAPLGDFRDWEGINAWAKSIADALKG